MNRFTIWYFWDLKQELFSYFTTFSNLDSSFQLFRKTVINCYQKHPSIDALQVRCPSNFRKVQKKGPVSRFFLQIECYTRNIIKKETSVLVFPLIFCKGFQEKLFHRKSFDNYLHITNFKLVKLVTIALQKIEKEGY